jgi:multimeric flavodoxin WrbA
LKICIINFSGRQNGNCHDVAKIIEQLLIPEHEVTLYEICDLNIHPCGKCRYECFSENKSCPYADDDVKSIYSSINLSDSVYYVVPNYSNYPNAYFYAYSERSQSIFSFQPPDLYEQYLQTDKKFIVISNTEEENFKRAFQYHVPENTKPNILFLAARTFDKRSVNGGLLESEKAKQMVVNFVKL